MEEDLIQTIKKITPAQLSDPAVRQRLHQEVEDLKITLADDTAKKMFWELTKKLDSLPAENSAVIKQEYADDLINLKLLSFTLWPEPEVKLILQNYLDRLLSWENFDLVKQWDDFIIPWVSIWQRNQLKKEVQTMLKENNLEITSQQLVDPQGKVFPPTIGQWLKLYELELGQGMADSILRAKFLYKSRNGRKLSVEEKAKVSKLIDFFEHLKIDSEHPRGL